MKILIIIPSCSDERILLLNRMLGSLMQSDHKELLPLVIADGNKKIQREVKRKGVPVILNEKRMDWIYSMNLGLGRNLKFDGYLYASDDLVFERSAIRLAAAAMRREFPDLDGVISIKQLLPGNAKGCSSAFGLIGSKFVDRFPQRRVFCPDYIHYYSDAELGRVATSLKKLVKCDEAKVEHARPRDETWDLAHLVLQRDKKMRELRRSKGWEWGLDFNLISGGKDGGLLRG